MRRSIVPWACALIVAMFLLLPTGRAQTNTPSVDERIAALEAEIKALREDVARLRDSAGTPPAARPAVRVPIDKAATKGSAAAKVVFIEFSDFECPFCGRYGRDTFPAIDREYVNTGRVQYVFKNFPIEQIHPHAMKAAESAECARRQGKYWQMHDRLFADQEELDEVDLVLRAKAVGLDMTAFATCMQGQTVPSIRQDLADGRDAGADATPTFFIGLRQPDGTLTIVRRLAGAQPVTAFRAALDDALGSATAGGSR